MIRLALLLLLAQSPLPDPAPIALPPPEAPAEARTVEAHAAEARMAPQPGGLRPLPDSAVAAIRADPRYQYDAPEAEKPGLRERIWMWILEHLLAPALRGSTTPAGLFFWVTLALLVVAVVAVRLFTTGIGGLFGRRGPRVRDGEDPLLGARAIEDVDLASLLASATARRDWRAAVRLRYLVALQRLDARGLVAWRPDKTNRTFVREAGARGGTDVGRAFGDVTRAFETVWYGGVAVTEARFGRIEARFARLDAALAEAPRVPLSQVAESGVAG